MSESSRMVALGRIVNTHGIRGEMRVLPYNPRTEALREGAAVTLRHAGASRSAEILTARRHKNLILVTLPGVDSMSAAEDLVGWEIAVASEALPAPAVDEAYHFQLLGLTVVTTTGDEVGVIEEVFTTAANDVCVVRGHGREHLIPYVEPIVRELDLAGGRLVIEPIPGLLDA